MQHQPTIPSQTDDTETEIFLYQASSLFLSRRCLTLINHNAWRFAGDPTALFDKLRGDLLFQLRQALDAEFMRGFREVDASEPVPLETTVPQIGRQALALAKRLDDGRVRKIDQRFTQPRGAFLLGAVHSVFGLQQAIPVIQALSERDRSPSTTVHSFDVRNSLFAFSLFVESLNTLAFATAYRGYERLLAEKCQDLDYFVDGYPHDLLAHDIHELRQDQQLKAICAREAYCSTTVVRDNAFQAQPGFRVYRIEGGNHAD